MIHTPQNRLSSETELHTTTLSEPQEQKHLKKHLKTQTKQKNQPIRKQKQGKIIWQNIGQLNKFHTTRWSDQKNVQGKDSPWTPTFSKVPFYF